MASIKKFIEDSRKNGILDQVCVVNSEFVLNSTTRSQISELSVPAVILVEDSKVYGLTLLYIPFRGCDGGELHFCRYYAYAEGYYLFKLIDNFEYMIIDSLDVLAETIKNIAQEAKEPTNDTMETAK